MLILRSKSLEEYNDVRAIQNHLKKRGIELTAEAKVRMEHIPTQSELTPQYKAYTAA
ncbi:hypothetical protein [Reichenbachiella agariperforans]|uniref:hypothetical protein n=1 Tax=Reichenbachiella agariperforans TaxID=156994 RepID=UPI001C098779|nr:hypothetical protein [Reichenbachiella agariperforans]MBU2912565.1 hypothetical protein [Reichenbachiella agariperforans]